MPKLIDMPVCEFVDALASDAPAPGGGSAAALAGAQAAALMAMVCRLTVGKKKYAAVEAEANAALAALETRRAELLALIDEDTEAYRAFGRAAALPKNTDDEKVARRQAMRAASKYAAEVPSRTLEAAADVARIIARMFRTANRNCLSDTGAGLQLAHAAVVGASLNVLINLPGTDDDAFNLAHAARVQALGDEIRALADGAAREISALLGA